MSSDNFPVGEKNKKWTKKWEFLSVFRDIRCLRKWLCQSAILSSSQMPDKILA